MSPRPTLFVATLAAAGLIALSARAQDVIAFATNPQGS